MGRKTKAASAKALAKKSVHADDQLTVEQRSSLGIRLERLQVERRDQNRELRHLRNEVEGLRAKLGIAAELQGQDAHALPIERGSGDEREAVACVAFSDWHAEERVRPEMVNGMNEYNLDIFQERAARAFQKALRLVQLHRGDGLRIDRMVVGLLGDLMTGLLHQDQQMTNSAGTPEAIRTLYRSLLSGFRMLLERGDFQHILVPCVTGNHGRTTKRRMFSADDLTSNERILYNQLEDAFADEERIEFVVGPGMFVYTDVLGHKIRWTHGDMFNYQGGIGGVLVGARRVVYTKWNAAMPADLTVMGHWHTLVWDTDIIINGSLIGPQAYGVAKAGAERPQQAFWLMDEKYGRSAMHPIFVTDQEIGVEPGEEAA